MNDTVLEPMDSAQIEVVSPPKLDLRYVKNKDLLTINEHENRSKSMLSGSFDTNN